CSYNGSNYTQLKSNADKTLDANNIRWNMENWDIFNPIVSNGNAPFHYYHPSDFLVNGTIEHGSYVITSNNTFSQIRSIDHGYRDQNVRSIINIGRFIFSIEDRLIRNDKILDLELMKDGDDFFYESIEDNIFVSNHELHAGDVTSLGKVLNKNIYNILV